MRPSQQKPLVSLYFIFHHGSALFVTEAQMVLRKGVILFGGFTIPLRRLRLSPVLAAVSLSFGSLRCSGSSRLAGLMTRRSSKSRSRKAAHPFSQRRGDPCRAVPSRRKD